MELDDVTPLENKVAAEIRAVLAENARLRELLRKIEELARDADVDGDE